MALWGSMERDAKYWISFRAPLICGNVGPVECGVADFLLIPSINSVVIPGIRSIWWAEMWLAEMCPSASREVGQQRVCASDVGLPPRCDLFPEPTLTSALLESNAATCWLFLVQHVGDLLNTVTATQAEALSKEIPSEVEQKCSFD